MVARQCDSRITACSMSLHFIGFGKDWSRLSKASMIFGAPDFVHYYWDVRARQELAPGDMAVFAVGTEADQPRQHAYNDSEAQ